LKPLSPPRERQELAATPIWLLGMALVVWRAPEGPRGAPANA